MLKVMKAWTKRIPVIGPLLVQLRHGEDDFDNSTDYWKQRYKSGGNSGPGSYNRLAEFKAISLNSFVEQHRVVSVIEYGSGDGAQLKLAQYPAYTGVDISPEAVEMCRVLFGRDTSKRFFQLDSVPHGTTADLALSLDVIFHLVEDAIFDTYMRRLFESAQRFVIIYSSNIDQLWPAKHVRHRQFTSWIELNKPDWRLHSTLKNAFPYDPADPDQTSFADFYVFSLQSK
jgi:SAM-dependent methyltransferase